MKKQDTIAALFFLTLIAALNSCKQTYDPPAIANPPTFLVVEGFINNGPDSTYFDLSHTYKLSDSTSTTPETGAAVMVEGSDNSVYLLGEVGNGQYGANLPTLNPTATYRLHIVTTANKQYASDFVPIVPNPPIDSISFIRNNNGLNIYANTHDPTNRAQFYRWEYQETWEFHSAYYATVLWQNNQLVTYSPNTINTCWKGDISTRLILGSTTQLNSDVVYQLPLVSVPLGAQQLSVKYSILVRQYAITQDAFNWWTLMQNNTENIGSIFGVQPTSDQGNLHCLTDTAEQVIGFVSAGNIQSQRIFITNDQVFPWVYEPPCTEELHSKNPDTIALYYSEGIWPIELTPDQTQVQESYKTCIDCTLTGSNIQPSFWQ